MAWLGYFVVLFTVVYLAARSLPRSVQLLLAAMCLSLAAGPLLGVRNPQIHLWDGLAWKTTLFESLPLFMQHAYWINHRIGGAVICFVCGPMPHFEDVFIYVDSPPDPRNVRPESFLVFWTIATAVFALAAARPRATARSSMTNPGPLPP